jgi:Saxitoxin biosynthesis operon protein SxtJ
MLKNILHELEQLDTTKTALRKFGWTVGAVFGAIALFIAYKHNWAMGTFTTIFGTIATFLLSVGTIFPTALRQIYRFWMGLALVMGFFMSKIILSIIYFVLITPTGYIRRTFGKSPILTKPDDSKSYWIPKSPAENPKEAMERAF